MLIKGTALRSLLSALRTVCGADGAARVEAALPAHARAVVQAQILAGTWYPVEIAAAVHKAIHDTVGRGAWLMNHRLGMEAARADFGAVYRAFIRVMDYDFVLDRIERAWGQYNSMGHITISNRTTGRASVRVSDVEGYSEGMWHAIAGRLQGVLLVSGAKSASVRVLSWTPTGSNMEASWG